MTAIISAGAWKGRSDRGPVDHRKTAHIRQKAEKLVNLYF